MRADDPASIALATNSPPAGTTIRRTRHCFRIVTPQKTFTVVAADVQQKYSWMRAIQHAIHTTLLLRNAILLLHDLSRRYHVPVLSFDGAKKHQCENLLILDTYLHSTHSACNVSPSCVSVSNTHHTASGPTPTDSPTTPSAAPTGSSSILGGCASQTSFTKQESNTYAITAIPVQEIYHIYSCFVVYSSHYIHKSTDCIPTYNLQLDVSGMTIPYCHICFRGYTLFRRRIRCTFCNVVVCGDCITRKVNVQQYMDTGRVGGANYAATKLFNTNDDSLQQQSCKRSTTAATTAINTSYDSSECDEYITSPERSLSTLDSCNPGSKYTPQLALQSSPTFEPITDRSVSGKHHSVSLSSHALDSLMDFQETFHTSGTGGEGISITTPTTQVGAGSALQVSTRSAIQRVCDVCYWYLHSS
uniref:PH domain-containing protein n=1 Tax=Lygus hesperus TaxID=30085 RepID=A0A146LJ66_LYGHE